MTNEECGAPFQGNGAYRSKAEVQIGRLLEREGIAYLYEHPLAVVDRSKTKIWYPDFTLPGYGMILEYFGMLADAGYAERTRHKMEVYRRNGVDGLFLTERSMQGDWPGRILSGIEGILEGRLAMFRDLGHLKTGGPRAYSCPDYGSRGWQ
jgi:hypothetical protein